MVSWRFISQPRCTSSCDTNPRPTRYHRSDNFHTYSVIERLRHALQLFLLAFRVAVVLQLGATNTSQKSSSVFQVIDGLVSRSGTRGDGTHVVRLSSA